ncbi:DUF4082 domain-containing protein [Myxococcus sp. SDU36]|uniref:DUF4082 domain-containing protein n=1 Tax=Myxococcus sp. SDU36 TaxID=2831967 RepID=UPI002542D1BA|nr:DUF4082 domain-containing protein [Myxococcus sp. SDU36]
MTPSKPRPNWVARQPRAHALALLATVLLALPTAARAQPTYTLFAPTSTPAVPSVTNDFAPVELGVKFQSDIEGDILGIRFYKGTANTGTHVGSLWSAAGARLAFATFTGETASGWQDYYYWPDYWVQDRPGLFTGSGLAMRFADLDGTPLDVYQIATQMTDESGQSYPLHIDTLLDNALGTQGYYGAFNANMHVDSQPSAGSSGSAAIIASAQREGVPVITAKQLLAWLDAREATQVSTVAFTGTVLTFDLASPARNLSLMVPTRTTTGQTLLSVTRAGAPVTTVTRTIKGVDFAFIDGALAGTYTATYN